MDVGSHGYIFLSDKYFKQTTKKDVNWAQKKSGKQTEVEEEEANLCSLQANFLKAK